MAAADKMPPVSPVATTDASNAAQANPPAAAEADIATEPTHTERARAAIADLAHAMDCNAPVSRQLLAELKDLLGVA